jgi:N-acetylglucosamine-6-sulfatase
MRILALIAVAASLAVAAGFAAQGKSAPDARRPNIILVLADDFSWNLVKYMPRVREMQAAGTTFSRFFVSNSLCCPSRATIFTGKYPHNTGVYTNGGRDGGFFAFHESGLEGETFATRLHSSGYRTALMGKYLNGYTPTLSVYGEDLYVPPGWDEWDVGGKGYANFAYGLNENRSYHYYGSNAEDYLTDVLAAKGVEYINRATTGRKPFFLEIAPFAPHSPYTPAPRHETWFPEVKAPRTSAFNEISMSDKPRWLKNRKALRRLQVSTIDEDFRMRVQAVQAIDELIGNLKDALAARGQLANTYIFFTSDNGLHMGEHRLAAGKQTAFEPDIHVPLIVTGPGVPRGWRLPQLTSTIDLYPTFAQLAGARVPQTVDGRSLKPLLAGQTVTGWRKAVLVEHHGPDVTRGDPDFPGPFGGNPPSYNALRTGSGTYVEYSNGDLEYYNLRKDPYQLTNTAKGLTPLARGTLHSQLTALVSCSGVAGCWTAAGGGH